ncbi:hypothetical protein DNTS_021863 [Danionella cerebrum]|uniref:Protein-glutamine gamma-glutamyltransferase K n=1 Tax=Danionella cerebrum TaxID=2873325 RepID=A0A553MZE0_9TELE|nr:hypothetical protein DNTS_021863 [Danionella translucida]
MINRTDAVRDGKGRLLPEMEYSRLDQQSGSKRNIFSLSLLERLLMVRSVDMQCCRDSLNRLKHHTDSFYSDNLIMRRGQSFQISIDLSRAFNCTYDNLELQLKLDSVSSSCRMQISIPLVFGLDEIDGAECWKMSLEDQEDTRVHLRVFTPSCAPIGRYTISVVCFSPRGKLFFPCYPDDLFLLYNPWCQDDVVYLEDEDERQEYILNSMGRMYYGTEDQIGARTWNYAQFEQGVLEASLYILEKGQVAVSERTDPVIISRTFSALVNSNDEHGVLIGNWTQNFEGGTPPTAWSGSGDILRQYHRSLGKPVKFAHCWVFSGVATTMMRCLGIPSRCVTNFSSAHDTDHSLTTDIYIDENLELIKDKTDFIWNFHTWSEAWMARPDLPVGFGGWQVVDPTPQECSQDLYRCGPTPVAAVRSGLVQFKYDTPFVFAEVNSDKIYWQRNADGSFRQINVEKNSIGKCISTKAVGSDERVDITDLYKYPEGSEEERIAVEMASRFGSKPTLYPQSDQRDVTLEVGLQRDEPQIPEDMEVFLIVKNQSKEKRSTDLLLELLDMSYTGQTQSKTEYRTHSIPPKYNTFHLYYHSKRLTYTVKYCEYKSHVMHPGAMLLTLTGRVIQTRQIMATQFNFRMRTPNLSITALEEAVVGEEFRVEVSFQNPLTQALNNVTFRFEGLGMQNVKKIHYGSLSVDDVLVEHPEGELPSVWLTRAEEHASSCALAPPRLHISSPLPPSGVESLTWLDIELHAVTVLGRCMGSHQLRSDVEELATITLMMKFVPLFSGYQKLLASLDSYQLTQVHGFADIAVLSK